jgi:hypothetical protein
MPDEAVDKAWEAVKGKLNVRDDTDAWRLAERAFRSGWAHAMYEQQQPRARRGDPDTSVDAAASVENLRRTQRRVYSLLIRPMTDEELVAEHIAAYGKNASSASGVRSRRAELVDLGLVVNAGIDGKTTGGRRCRRWVRRENAGLLA